VGLKLDCYYLDYFTDKIHFAGHYVAMYGYDNDFAYLVDTQQQGGRVKTSLKSLELARNAKGPMSSRNLVWTIHNTGKTYHLQDIIKTAIKNNAEDYLNPPIKNIGYKGILKTSSEIKKWFKKSKDIEGEFKTTATLMERAGTGGALFRNLYRDFLKESFELLKSEVLQSAYHEFVDIASQWTRVSKLFTKAGETQDIQYIHQASEILANLSEREKNTMETLLIVGI
jgi:predicted PolB exonuclease-like 3'-5' exonuclease